MSAFAYLSTYISAKISKIKDLLSMKKIAKNWIEVALFRVGAKKTLTIKFRDGKSVYFKNKKEYFNFWRSELGQNELSKQLKTSHYKIKDQKIELNYQNEKIYFYYDVNKQPNDVIGLINENFGGGSINGLMLKINM